MVSGAGRSLRKHFVIKPFKLLQLVSFTLTPYTPTPGVSSWTLLFVLPLGNGSCPQSNGQTPLGGTRAAAPQPALRIWWVLHSLALSSAFLWDLSAPHSAHLSHVELGIGHLCPHETHHPSTAQHLLSPWKPLLHKAD